MYNYSQIPILSYSHTLIIEIFKDPADSELRSEVITIITLDNMSVFFDTNDILLYLVNQLFGRQNNIRINAR